MQLPYLLNPIWGYVIDKTHKYQDEKVHLMMGVIFVGMACFGFSQIHAPSSIYFWLCGFLMCFGGAWFDAALGAYRSHFARDFGANVCICEFKLSNGDDCLSSRIDICSTVGQLAADLLLPCDAIHVFFCGDYVLSHFCRGK